MLPRKIKLRVAIFVGVLLITTALAALLLLLNWLSSARSVRTFTRDLLDPVARQVTEHTRDMLDSAASAAVKRNTPPWPDPVTATRVPAGPLATNTPTIA
jgi:hypothetical protein